MAFIQINIRAHVAMSVRKVVRKQQLNIFDLNIPAVKYTIECKRGRGKAWPRTAKSTNLIALALQLSEL